MYVQTLNSRVHLFVFCYCIMQKKLNLEFHRFHTWILDSAEKHHAYGEDFSAHAKNQLRWGRVNAALMYLCWKWCLDIKRWNGIISCWALRIVRTTHYILKMRTAQQDDSTVQHVWNENIKLILYVTHRLGQFWHNEQSSGIWLIWVLLIIILTAY